MKWLILLFLFVILAAIMMLRYRQQITGALQIWRMFRQFKQAARPPEKKIESNSIDKNTPLVNCARCGKWITVSDALKLRSKTYYCSAQCMEKAARLESLVD